MTLYNADDSSTLNCHATYLSAHANSGDTRCNVLNQYIVCHLFVLSGSDFKNAFTLLHEAEGKIKKIIIEKFDEAVRMSDRASIER